MGNTNCIFYENVNNEVKAKILSEFKNTYSDKNIKEILVLHKSHKAHKIYLNKSPSLSMKISSVIGHSNKSLKMLSNFNKVDLLVVYLTPPILR